MAHPPPEHQHYTHSPPARKPALRSNTSSSTTFSSMSSMTSGSSSIGSPTTFSPNWTGGSFSSPWDHADKERQVHHLESSAGQSSAHGHPDFSYQQHYGNQQPVIEQSATEERGQHATRSLQPKYSGRDADTLDLSGTSTSSTDTLAAGSTQMAKEQEGSTNGYREEGSSSSSSSSPSSILSESQAARAVYETPLTASLNQTAIEDCRPHAREETSADAYPFPVVDEQSQGHESRAKSSKVMSHDPWKHTDDLLAPVGRPAQTGVSQKVQQAAASSSLSQSKPSPGHAAPQHVSTSQAPTPTAAEMDRRDSQSSSQSSLSGPKAIPLASHSSSAGNLAKLSTSSSPTASGALASFSPLSPLVEPFSPSSIPLALPNKSASAPKAALANASRIAACQPAGSKTAQASYVEASLTAQAGAKLLENSTTSSSSDTGYFSHGAAIQPPDHGYYGLSSAVTSQHANAQSADSVQGGSISDVQALHNARQRAWREKQSLANGPDPNMQGLNSNVSGRQVDESHWTHPQQTSYAPIEASSGVVSQPAAHGGHGYPDARYIRQGSAYETAQIFAGNLPSSLRGAPPVPSNLRSFPVARSIDSFDAGRYGYGPPSVSDVSIAGTEEISTIFVVGFPEDIQEREFQNMFLFARGFEAATLKIPASTAAARERDAAAAAAVSAIAATLPAYSVPPPPPALDPNHGYGLTPGGSSYDHLNNSLYEETFLAAASGTVGPHGHVESAQRVSSALAAAALTATASTASLANTTNKKQIIGFAKFRCRDDAMTARDVLSGRKIDPEKGCVLKAEMAKKNLHVKKSGSDVQGTTLPALSQETISTPRESALDRLAEREREREWRARMVAAASGGHVFDGSSTSGYHHGSEHDVHQDLREVLQEPPAREASWPDATYEAFHSVPSEQSALQNLVHAERRFSSSRSARPSPEHFQHDLGNNSASAAAAAHQRALTGTSNFGKTLLQQLDDQDDANFPLPDPNPGFGASAYSAGPGEHGSKRQPPPAALPTKAIIGHLGGHVYIDEDYRKLSLHGRQEQDTSVPQHSDYERTEYALHQGQLSSKFHEANATTPTSATAALGAGSRRFTSPDLVSPTFTEFRQPRTQNRADDNMPISTLYVGGLPSSLPSLAGSVSASQLEDALRSVFTRCPGFRRMSFRQKSQGPMCFIEFEDTQHATRALNEIYGHTLGGLVKGGIRLAYSKNPLGVRGSGSNGPDSPGPLSPSYFASDIYSQNEYRGPPSASFPVHAQVPTPTLHSRSAHYEQQGYPSGPGDYGGSPASQQALAFHQQQHQQHRVSQDHRHMLERRATSPETSGQATFSPFALDR